MNTFYNAKNNPKNNYYGYCLMSIDELLKSLSSLNNDWVKIFENNNKELINKAYEIERKINKVDVLGSSVSDFKILELKGSKLKIFDVIIDSFKKSTDLNNISINKKKFIYKNKEEIPKIK